MCKTKESAVTLSAFIMIASVSNQILCGLYNYKKMEGVDLILYGINPILWKANGLLR